MIIIIYLYVRREQYLLSHNNVVQRIRIVLYDKKYIIDK